MTRMRCANCATVFNGSEDLCPGCGLGVEAIGVAEPGLGGSDLSPTVGAGEERTCPECEAAVAESDEFCEQCGAELEP